MDAAALAFKNRGVALLVQPLQKFLKASVGKDIQFQGNKISYSFPAHSFTQILVPLK